MIGAFNGKYLRVNLTEGTTAVEQFPELDYRLFMGGSAMAAAILMRELKPGVDPLGPDNILVFSTCPLNGIPLSGTNRFTAAAKSPLTDGYGEGEAGGWWGPELKFAGFDGIIVTGQSPKPVYLWIQDGQVELRDAAHLWGKRPYSTEVSARDNWFLAFFTHGEGFHNFHHAFPSDFRNGLRWYHWDPNKWAILALRLTGLARNLRRTPMPLIERARARVLEAASASGFSASPTA